MFSDLLAVLPARTHTHTPHHTRTLTSLAHFNFACVYACVYACTCVRVYVCMNIRMYACKYVLMYACKCVHVYAYTCVPICVLRLMRHVLRHVKGRCVAYVTVTLRYWARLICTCGLSRAEMAPFARTLTQGLPPPQALVPPQPILPLSLHTPLKTTGAHRTSAPPLPRRPLPQRLHTRL